MDETAKIARLLREADSADRAQAPSVEALVAGARAGVGRRMRRRRALAGAGAVTVLAAALGMVLWPGGETANAPPMAGDDLPQAIEPTPSLAMLESELRVAELTAASLDRRQRLRHAHASVEAAALRQDLLAQIRMEHERAGQVLFHHAQLAERRALESADPAAAESARQEYRQVIEIFPETAAAELARQRLAGEAG